MTGGEDIENVAAATETGLVADAAASGRLVRRNKGEGGDCANCGVMLGGPYCHACGQHDADLRRPFWSLAAEVVEGLFSLDGRVLNTLPALMFRPGRMTARYLAGERARYVQPFRLYLIASVLFFVSLALLGPNGVGFNPEVQARSVDAGLEEAAVEPAASGQAATDREENETADGRARAEQAARAAQIQAAEALAQASEDTGLDLERLASADAKAEWKREVRAELLPETLSVEDLEEIRGNENALNLGFAETMPRAQREWLYTRIERVIDDPGRLWAAMGRWAPRLMFVLLPIYALTLAVMHFWRRDFVFYDHLIVSLHAHAFLFLLMTLLVLVSMAGAAAWAPLIFLLWSNFYVYRLHRRVYRHGRVSSVFRTITLDVIYFVVLTFALIALLFVGVAFV